MNVRNETCQKRERNDFRINQNRAAAGTCNHSFWWSPRACEVWRCEHSFLVVIAKSRGCGIWVLVPLQASLRDVYGSVGRCGLMEITFTQCQKGRVFGCCPKIFFWLVAIGLCLVAAGVYAGEIPRVRHPLSTCFDPPRQGMVMLDAEGGASSVVVGGANMATGMHRFGHRSRWLDGFDHEHAV